MMAGGAPDTPTVAVVGGGLAGLATAVALVTEGCRVELFESRRFLGGRAASFVDPATGELVDHCQHVSMGCCTNLADFCRRTEIADYFRRDRLLHFIGPDGQQYNLEPARWLPAPLHLAPGFLGLRYLSLGDRYRIARAMWKLMRTPVIDDAHAPTIGQWLVNEGQSPRAIEQFWSVILVSTLAESLNRSSLAAARKVLVDGFLSAREASVVEVPQAPLGTLYGARLESWLAAHGVALHLNTPVRQIACDGRPAIALADGRETRPNFVVLAVPWPKVRELLAPQIAAQWPWLRQLDQIHSAPITGVHLWFDRPITDLPHAVIVGRLSQWIFQHTARESDAARPAHYYQVVISASHELAGRDRRQIVEEVCGDLAAIWPQARAAQCLQARVVTEHDAVFSVSPGLDRARPAQQTPIPRLLLAGDWTATGWPATMESAVRSGYLAAESVLRSLGRLARCLVPDLPRGPLARLLIKN